MAACGLGGGERKMGKRLDFKTCLAGRVQISTVACTSEAGDSNLVGVGVHPTQTLFVPNTPTPSQPNHGKEHYGPESSFPTAGLFPGVSSGSDPESGLENSHLGPNSLVLCLLALLPSRPNPQSSKQRQGPVFPSVWVTMHWLSGSPLPDLVCVHFTP